MDTRNIRVKRNVGKYIVLHRIIAELLKKKIFFENLTIITIVFTVFFTLFAYSHTLKQLPR